MKEEFKTFLLTEWEITEEEYRGGSFEAKAKLVEAFEKSKSQGELHSVFCFILTNHFFVCIS